MLRCYFPQERQDQNQLLQFVTSLEFLLVTQLQLLKFGHFEEPDVVPKGCSLKDRGSHETRNHSLSPPKDSRTLILFHRRRCGRCDGSQGKSKLSHKLRTGETT